MLFLATAPSVKQFVCGCSVYDLNFDKSLYAEFPSPYHITSALGHCSALWPDFQSTDIHLCPSNVFLTADLTVLLLLKNFQCLLVALRTKTFAWPLTHLPLCFMCTGGLTRLDIFFFLPRAFVYPSCLLDHSHPALHLNPLAEISLVLRGLP